MIKNSDAYNVTLKWPLTLRLLRIRAAILDFRWTIYFHLMQRFAGGNIFKKSHKNTPLHLYRFQRYELESGLGVILPPVGHRRVNYCGRFILRKNYKVQLLLQCVALATVTITSVHSSEFRSIGEWLRCLGNVTHCNGGHVEHVC